MEGLGFAMGAVLFLVMTPLAIGLSVLAQGGISLVVVWTKCLGDKGCRMR